MIKCPIGALWICQTFQTWKSNSRDLKSSISDCVSMTCPLKRRIGSFKVICHAEFEEGSCKFSCKVFFAEQFDALRHKCGCEESFIDSLARCVQWDASGGKSGSAFLKTRGRLHHTVLVGLSLIPSLFYDYRRSVHHQGNFTSRNGRLPPICAGLFRLHDSCILSYGTYLCSCSF